MKRQWIGFAALMIMVLAVTVWADTGPSGLYRPCTVDNPSGKNNFPVDCSQTIKGVGQVLRYQLGKNVWVGVNLNLETLYLATATGSGFTHPAFGFIRNEISDAAREYFGQYQKNSDALWMDQLSMKYQMIPERRFPSNIVGGVLCVEPVFGKQIIYENGNSPDAKKMGKRLKRFYNKTAANNFFQNKLSFYNQMTQSFVTKYQLDYIQPLERFFGMEMSRERFEVILSPLYYGAEALEVKNLDGSTTFINIMNPVYRAGDGDDWILDALYHEAAHNFLEVVFSNHAKQIKEYEPYLKAITTDARGVVKDSFKSYLGEMLARVVSLVMLEQNHGREMAERNLNLEISRGWTNLNEFYALVKNGYLTERPKYPTFDSFLPVVLEYIKAQSPGK